MAYSRAAGQPDRNSQQKYYLPRIDLKKYNVIIVGRNFYDNPINIVTLENIIQVPLKNIEN